MFHFFHLVFLVFYPLSPRMNFLHTHTKGERVLDIAFWKSELNNEIGAMQTEIENLKVQGETCLLSSHLLIGIFFSFLYLGVTF